MNLLFLIGNEGAGHHLFAETCSFKQDEGFHNLLLDYFSNESCFDSNKSKKSEINNYIASCKNLNHIERASFPYNRPLDSLRRFDIKLFKDLFYGREDVNVFFIICLRDVVQSTLSAWERFDRHTGVTLFHTARAQEDNLIYICSQSKLLPYARTTIVEYENICDHFDSFGEYIRDESGMRELSFDSSKVKKSNKVRTNKDLENYFDLDRRKQFDYLFNNLTIF